MIKIVNGICRDSKGRFCKKPLPLWAEEKQISKKKPLKSFYQMPLYLPPKATLAVRCKLVDPAAFSLDPYKRTYQVLAWGTAEKAPGEEGLRLEGTVRVIREIPYREVVKMHQEAMRVLCGEDPKKAAIHTLLEGNIGEGNRGVYNAGRDNYGLHNQGVGNYGIYNKGCCVMGCFNTSRNSFYMFDQPVHGLDWKDVDALLPDFLRVHFKYGYPAFDDENPEHYEILSLEEAFEQESKRPDWNMELKKLYALPNFDFVIFQDITGISKKMLDNSYKQWEKKYGKKRKRKQ